MITQQLQICYVQGEQYKEDILLVKHGRKHNPESKQCGQKVQKFGVLLSLILYPISKSALKSVHSIQEDNNHTQPR